MRLQEIDLADFDYPLDEEKIAFTAAEPRDSSRLLVMKDGNISSSVFSNIATFLPSGSLLVWNNTRVIHARLLFSKESGARIEVFCLEPVNPEREVQRALQQGPGCVWKCLVGNARKWKTGLLQMEIQSDTKVCTLTAEKIGVEEGQYLVRFNWSDTRLCLAEVLEIAGKVPLPPYIMREATLEDTVRYQTVYAQHDGSVAAPTAGLHFSANVIESLTEKNIRHANVTLHVGAGTFIPVTASDIRDHKMHTEQIHLQKGDLDCLIAAEDNIVAVGTTSLRTLESFYWLGVKLHYAKESANRFSIEQWDPYDGSLPQDIPLHQAWSALAEHMKQIGLDEIIGETRLLIMPGYKIRTAKMLITNFHQPRSTLLLLVSAFVGDAWKDAYDYALKNNYRFLSYGDACLFVRK